MFLDDGGSSGSLRVDSGTRAIQSLLISSSLLFPTFSLPPYLHYYYPGSFS